MAVIERLDFLGVPTQDPERSRAFYRDVLGLRPDEHDAWEQWAGDTFDTGVCHMAIFADPDGNQLMLHRRYAPYE